MPPRSKVEALPKGVKEWLDRALVDGNFAGYEALAGELKARGHDISKTAVHRYGQAFEERLSALKLATEQARAVVEAAPDEDDTVNQALVRITQEKLFTLMMDIEIDPEKVDISKITKSIADLARSSVNLKRYAAEAAEAARRKLLVEQQANLEKIAKKQGMSQEQLDFWIKDFLGVR